MKFEQVINEATVGQIVKKYNDPLKKTGLYTPRQINSVELEPGGKQVTNSVATKALLDNGIDLRKDAALAKIIKDATANADAYTETVPVKEKPKEGFSTAPVKQDPRKPKPYSNAEADRTFNKKAYAKGW